MRHAIAALLAILAITLTPYYLTGGPALTGSVTGNVVSSMPQTGSLLLASGFVEPESRLTLRDGSIVFEGGSITVLTADLVDSTADDALFFIQKTDATGVAKGFSLALPTKRGSEGGLYAPVTVDDLVRLRSISGAGRYVLVAETAQGATFTTAIILE